MKITKEDISFSHYYHSMQGFSVEVLTISVLSDHLMYDLEKHVSESGYECDMFNTEYMGYLTGYVDKGLSIDELTELINSFMDKYNI